MTEKRLTKELKHWIIMLHQKMKTKLGLKECINVNLRKGTRERKLQGKDL